MYVLQLTLQIKTSSIIILLCILAVQTTFAVRGTIISKKNSLLTIERYNSEEELDELEEQYSEERTDLEKHRIYEQGETRDFLYFLRKINYDHRQCPPIQKRTGPVVINVSIVISNIRAVSEGTMDYNIEMFYREYWTDRRLSYSGNIFKNKSELSLHESYSNFLWHPDTFMPNSIASKNPRQHSITHRSLLRLRNDGRVLYSRRLSLIVTCGMDLTLFPFDSQLCKLGIESYGYTAEQVRYSWSQESTIPALALHEVRLPDFKVKEAFVTSRMESYATGNYSRLYVCFVFSRAAGFCFLQLIIPSTAVVITSWVSLWMENETSFQDMISIILTITFLLFSYNEVMPRVSYIKAMDVYLGVCFCIVFFSLIKLAMVKYMRQRLIFTKDAYTVPATSAAGASPSSTTSRNVNIIMNNKNDNHSAIKTSLKDNSSNIMKKHDGLLPLGAAATILTVEENYNSSSTEALGRFSTLNTFTPQFMRRFHWISQISFFFGFVIFCLFYFLLYPNIYAQLIDQDCERASSEWFAETITV